MGQGASTARCDGQHISATAELEAVDVGIRPRPPHPLDGTDEAQLVQALTSECSSFETYREVLLRVEQTEAAVHGAERITKEERDAEAALLTRVPGFLSKLMLDEAHTPAVRPPPIELSLLRSKFAVASQDLHAEIEATEQLGGRAVEVVKRRQRDRCATSQLTNGNIAHEVKLASCLRSGKPIGLTGEEADGREPVDPRKARALMGLPEGASLEEVEQAYRTLSRVFHPDRAGVWGPQMADEMADTFRQLNVCYTRVMENGKHKIMFAGLQLAPTMARLVALANKLRSQCMKHAAEAERRIESLREEGKQNAVWWAAAKALRCLSKAARVYCDKVGALVCGRQSRSSRQGDCANEALHAQEEGEAPMMDMAETEAELLRQFLAFQHGASEDLHIHQSMYGELISQTTILMGSGSLGQEVSEAHMYEALGRAKRQSSRTKSAKALKHEARATSACFDMLRIPRSAPVELIKLAYKAWSSVCAIADEKAGAGERASMLQRLEEAYLVCLTIAESGASSDTGKPKKQGCKGNRQEKASKGSDRGGRQGENDVEAPAAVCMVENGAYVCDELD